MGKYLSIDDWSKKHIKNFLNFLLDEVVSSGGDGDALWYSRFYDIKDIYPIVEEVNKELNYSWKIKLEDDHINWGHHQEGIIITNNEEIYKNSPSWQQILIKY